MRDPEVKIWSILGIITVVFCIVGTIYANNPFLDEMIETEVVATITNKEHIGNKTNYIPISAGDVFYFILQDISEKHTVTITYEDVSITIEDKELYDSYNENDTITMILQTAYDKKGNITKQRLILPEE